MPLECLQQSQCFMKESEADELPGSDGGNGDARQLLVCSRKTQPKKKKTKVLLFLCPSPKDFLSADSL